MTTLAPQPRPQRLRRARRRAGPRALPRLRVAPHARPVRGARERGDAAADAGRPRRASLRRLARGLPDARGARGRAARGRARVVAGARLQPPRDRAQARRRAGRRRAPQVPDPPRFPPTRPLCARCPASAPRRRPACSRSPSDCPSVYLETNVRTVFLHELFADRDGVPDREIVPLVEAAVRRGRSARASRRASGTTRCSTTAPTSSATLPNPSRRSAHHTRQSQVRGLAPAEARLAAAGGDGEPGSVRPTSTPARSRPSSARRVATPCLPRRSRASCAALADEGFIAERDGGWFVA